MNAYERLYKPIIEDLTRRFDRVEAALERLLDLDLPEWAHAEVTAALFYAETTIGDRDEADAARRLRDAADDDDEWDSSHDDTVNDYADVDDLDEDPDDLAEDDDDDFVQRPDHNPHVCLCDECTIWRMAGGVNWTPDSMVLARERFAEQQQAAAACAVSPGQTETTRPVFGYGPHLALARQKVSKR